MNSKSQTKRSESDIVQIKAINEDTYWSKEYGITVEQLKNMDYDTGIFDKIVESHIKTQNTSN